MQFGPYTFEPSNLDKVLFPDDDITKAGLIDYLVDVAEYMLPHIKDRPLAMKRYPDGIKEESFYQKAVPDYFPDWIETVSVTREEQQPVNMVVANNKATLAYLGNQACIESHVFLSNTDDLDKPTKMIFDLDPPEGSFDMVIKAAKALRKKLYNSYSLKAFVMTTGSRGMHVIVPLRTRPTFDEVRNFASKVCKELENDHKDEFTTSIRKDQRKGKLFLDYLKNSKGQHSIAPYSPRGIRGAPVACPLEWEELDELKEGAQTFKIKNIIDRLKKKGDPWKGIMRHATLIDI